MSTLIESPTALAKLLGISVSYAGALKLGTRPWTMPLALRLYREDGSKVGPLAGASDEDIAVIARFTDERAQAGAPA